MESDGHGGPLHARRADISSSSGSFYLGVYVNYLHGFPFCLIQALDNNEIQDAFPSRFAGVASKHGEPSPTSRAQLPLPAAIVCVSGVSGVNEVCLPYGDIYRWRTFFGEPVAEEGGGALAGQDSLFCHPLDNRETAGQASNSAMTDSGLIPESSAHTSLFPLT